MRTTTMLGLVWMIGCAEGEPAPVPELPSVPCDDADADGACDDVDLCEGDDSTGDADEDDICDDLDACVGDDAIGDADEDGICDDLDACVGDDTIGDADEDGVCDDLDRCEGDDAVGDADADGLCDDVDDCFGDNATGDADADGRCADVDACDDRFNPNDEPICNVLFVAAGAVGSGDGSTWADAFPHPADALAVAEAGEEIWVAEGVYGPAVAQQRFALDLVEDVAMFGGFDGTELDLADRAGRFEQTIISGDFLGDDDPSQPDDTMTDNVNSLVRTSIGAVLDGFWLEGAYAPNDEQSGVGVSHNARGAFTLRNATLSNVQSNGSRGILFLNSRNPGTVIEDVSVVDSTGTAIIGFSGGMDVVGFTVRVTGFGVSNFGSGTIVGSHWSIETTNRALSNSGGSVTVSNAALWSSGGTTVNSNGGSVTITDACANQDLGNFGGPSVHLDGSTPELGFPFVEDGPNLFLAQGIAAGFTSACVDAGGVALHSEPARRSTAVDGTVDSGAVDAGAAYLVP